MSDELAELPTRTVLRSSRVALEKHTINTLITAIGDEWRKTEVGRPERIQYVRGGSLLIERWVAGQPSPDALASMLSPFQAIRTLSEIAISPETKSPLVSICLASQQLHNKGAPPRILVCRDIRAFRRWLAEDLEIDQVLGVRLLEDSEVSPAARCFLCGSAMGDMLHDIEYAILISKEDA